MMNKSSRELHRPALTADQPWLTVKDIAKRYQVTEVCIWLWVKSGRLPPPHRLGPQTRRWPPKIIEAFESKGIVGGEK
jgi:predicted DNA-binding transcriptional regulator AlpA